MLLAIGLLIAVGLAAFVATPLLSAEGGGSFTLPVDVTPIADLKRRRLVVYENLKDLEFEYQAGKITIKENFTGASGKIILLRPLRSWLPRRRLSN